MIVVDELVRGTTMFVSARWGLIPYWAKDPKGGAQPNQRQERDFEDRVVPREGGDWQVSNVRCRANRQLCPFQDCGSLIYYSDHLVRRIRFAHMQPATRARA